MRGALEFALIAITERALILIWLAAPFMTALGELIYWNLAITAHFGNTFPYNIIDRLPLYT